MFAHEIGNLNNCCRKLLIVSCEAGIETASHDVPNALVLDLAISPREVEESRDRQLHMRRSNDLGAFYDALKQPKEFGGIELLALLQVPFQSCGVARSRVVMVSNRHLLQQVVIDQIALWRFRQRVRRVEIKREVLVKIGPEFARELLLMLLVLTDLIGQEVPQPHPLAVRGPLEGLFRHILQSPLPNSIELIFRVPTGQAAGSRWLLEA